MWSTLLFIAIASSVEAHKGCGGHEVIRRNPGGPVTSARGSSKRADSSEFHIGRAHADPCAGYNYPPTAGLASKYPTNWEIASIPSTDTTAQAAFNTLNAKVQAALPNDQPKGTAEGNFTGVSYNGGTDPDCWWSYTGCTDPKRAAGLVADISTVPEPGSYGLTYDDGPNCGNAPLYDWMAENGVRATFNVLNWPIQAINGYQGGHEICVHTWSHHYMTSLTNEQVFAELYYTKQAIKDVLGITPTCWRPPYGDIDNRVRMFAAGLGLTSVLWSDDTADWTLNLGNNTAKVDANYQAVIDKMKNGEYTTHGPVVLSHELSNNTIDEALKYLPSLKSTFTHLVPIAVAYNLTHPYAEQNIFYPTFAEYVAGDLNTTTSAVSSASSSSTSAPTSTSTSASSTVMTSSTSATSSASSAASTANHNVSVSAGWRVASGWGLAGVAVSIIAGLIM